MDVLKTALDLAPCTFSPAVGSAKAAAQQAEAEAAAAAAAEAAEAAAESSSSSSSSSSGAAAAAPDTPPRAIDAPLPPAKRDMRVAPPPKRNAAGMAAADAAPSPRAAQALRDSAFDLRKVSVAAAASQDGPSWLAGWLPLFLPLLSISFPSLAPHRIHN